MEKQIRLNFCVEEKQSSFWLRWNKHYKFEVLQNLTTKMNSVIKFRQFKEF